MSRVRVAAVGAGLIGRHHIRLIRDSGSCESSAIVDPALGAADSARGTGVPKYPVFTDMLDAERPDGVIVATPNSLHVQHGLECVEHRDPVLVEKPIADSVDEAGRLVEAAEAAKVPLLVAHHRRRSPILAEARQVAQDGTLGTMVAVMGSALTTSPATTSTRLPGGAKPAAVPS